MQMLLRNAEYLYGLGAFNLRSLKAPSHTAETLAHRSILQAFSKCPHVGWVGDSLGWEGRQLHWVPQYDLQPCCGHSVVCPCQ